jgi:hypothetical protein
MEINVAKFNLRIKLEIKRNHYYLIYSPLIHEYVGSTVDEGIDDIDSHDTLIEVSKKEWLRHRND